MRLEFGNNTKMALDTLRGHKTRSFLTVLGVVIGIIALMGVASIMVGMDRQVRDYLNDYGANTLFIFKWNPGIHTNGRLSPEERSRKPLTPEDAEAILAECPAIKNVTAEIFPRIKDFGPQRLVSARYGHHESFNIQYTGEWPSYEEVFNAHPYKGRFFTDAENIHRSDVVVIGYDLGEAFFGQEDAIGKNIVVDGTSYRVVGVLQRRKSLFIRDDSADRLVLVPFRTYQRHNPGDDEIFIGAEAYPGQKAAAQDEVRGLLRRRRRVPFDKPDSFGISSAEEIANQLRQITGAIALVTVVVSSIGLLVGGVGVMNIMLMSVTERTREIGVRKAIGARRADIVRQFLTEAVVLTGSGGIIGVLIGAGLSLMLNRLLPNIPSSIPAWGVFGGVFMSMSVGLIFGIYPAWQAARLDPVDALRYE
jgi:putative ABC transport system permease protein